MPADEIDDITSAAQSLLVAWQAAVRTSRTMRVQISPRGCVFAEPGDGPVNDETLRVCLP